jgi:hypothetical protein
VGIGNPKTGEEQEAQKAEQVQAVQDQYEEARRRRVSPEGKEAVSGERSQIRGEELSQSRGKPHRSHAAKKAAAKK